MKRTWILLGVAAAFVIVLAGCAPEKAAPEVVPSDETLNATPADDSANRTGKENGETTGAQAKTGDAPIGEDQDRDTSEASDPIGPGPDKAADAAPALSLPRLPIGGDATEPDSAGVQCAEVNWLGTPGSAADLTPGIRVMVTNVVFSPAVFTLRDGGCGSAPPCKGFVYQVGAARCTVAAAPRPGAVDPGGPYFFTVTGRIDCTTLGKQRCAAFAQAVAGEQDQSISLSAPSSTNESDDSDVPDPGTGTTGGTDSDGQSGDGAAGTSNGTGSNGDAPSDSGTGGEPPQPSDPTAP